MKVCLVSNLYPPHIQGGAEVYVERLARALAARHAVVVLTTEPGHRLSTRREVTPEGVAVYRLAPLNLAYLTQLPHRLLPQALYRLLDLAHPQVFAQVRRVLAVERPDVVHVHNWIGLSLSAVLAASRPLGIPTVLTLHDYSLLCIYAALYHPDGHACGPDRPCRLLTAFHRRLTAPVRLVISPSAYVLDAHRRRGLFRGAELRRLPYGIAPEGAPTTRTGKATFDVLFMGRVQRHKGPQVLVRAFRRLADARLRLHLAGQGPAVDDCRRLAGDDARIAFHGFVHGERKRALLDNADVLALPSLWPDNQPVSIQEAFLAGAVVVASRIGGIPEMVQDGVTGLLVTPEDEAGLAAALDRLSRDPGLSDQLRVSAANAARGYDMATHVARLTHAYQALRTPVAAGDREAA